MLRNLLLLVHFHGECVENPQTALTVERQWKTILPVICSNTKLLSNFIQPVFLTECYVSENRCYQPEVKKWISMYLVGHIRNS
jgi:hypothetical protein